MKCSEVENKLSLYASDELTPKEKTQIQSHLQECPQCRQELALHRKASVALDGLMRAPAGLREKTLLLSSKRGPQPWLARIVGDPKMRKLAAVTTAAAALAICFFALAPKPAQASSPKETLAKMNSALALAAAQGEIVLNVETTKEGQVTVTGSMDGAALPKTFPIDVKVTSDGEIATVEITLSFNEPLFEAIKFGRERNTLEIVPIGSKDRKHVVGLDPKTSLPLFVRNLQLKNGVWTETSRSSFKPRALAQTKPSEMPKIVKATVKMKLGQKAIVTIKTTHG